MAKAWKYEICIRPVIEEWENGDITIQETAKRIHALLVAHPLTKDEDFTDEMFMWAESSGTTDEDVDCLLYDIYDFFDEHRIWSGKL